MTVNLVTGRGPQPRADLQERGEQGETGQGRARQLATYVHGQAAYPPQSCASLVSKLRARSHHNLL